MSAEPDNISLACFGGNLLKSDDHKFWDDSQILATASTEAFWDDDEPEEKIRKEILRAKHQFHLNRQLLIKHLPRDVTEEVLFLCILLDNINLLSHFTDFHSTITFITTLFRFCY